MICNPRIWSDALCRIQEEIPDFAFAAWIRPLAIKVDDDSVVLGCPSSFHRDRVRIQFQDALERHLSAAMMDADAATHSERAEPSIDVKSVSIELVAMTEFTKRSGLVLEVTETHAAEAVERREAVALRRMRSATAHSAEHRIAVETGGPSSGFRSVQVSRSRPTTMDASSGSKSGPDLDCDSNPDRRGSASGQRLEAVPSRREVVSANRGISSSAPARHRMSSTFDAPAAATPAYSSSSLSSSSSRASKPTDGALQTELPFSFESFVVGPCNALAREAALALARTRQRSLNLLYLGGDSGMGKTHLARATAAEARRHSALAERAADPFDPVSRSQSPDAHSWGARRPRRGETPGIVYTSAEQFTTDFVSAMRNGRSEDFKRRYRGSIGLLVVEDIQFFSGRVKTQLELFHTVQHVLDAGGRVLLTGDRTPRELTGLDDRVRAQVGRGFVAELEPPDAIVRRHILRSKASAGGVHLPANCLDLLVDASQGSVRDIESILIQVVTTSSLLGRAIDLDLTQDAIALKSNASPVLAPRKVAVSEIVRIVAAFFGKRPEALASRSRRRDVLVPRQLAMYLAHRYTEASFAEIGRGLGRGHPSVRNAIERIERQILENAPIRYQVEALSERVDSTLKNAAAHREDRGPDAH